jgi:hypothetical protein
VHLICKSLVGFMARSWLLLRGSINLGFFDESQNSESTFSVETIRILSFCRICIYFRLRIVFILPVWELTRNSMGICVLAKS